MQVLAEAGADVGQSRAAIQSLAAAKTIDDPDIDLQAVLSASSFHPVVEFEEGADQNQAIRRTL